MACNLLRLKPLHIVYVALQYKSKAGGGQTVLLVVSPLHLVATVQCNCNCWSPKSQDVEDGC